MNRLRHLMSLCIFISLMACEQNEDWVVNEPMQSFEENPEYAPLNTIPDWVSEKVTPKEYELWRTMSSMVEINYSFLKKDISEKRKKEIYDCINNICERIEKEQINKYEGFLNIADEDGTTLSDSQYFGRIATRSPEGGAEYKTNGCTLYTHSLGPYIKAAVTYKKSDDDVTITSSSVYTGSPYLGNDPSFSGASSVSYDKDKKLIAASCSGTLSFKDGSRKVEVTVQKTGFMIP